MAPIDDVYLDALRELKHPIGDVHAELHGEGFWPRAQVTLKNGWRMGIYRSFVEPLLNKGLDITVLPFAQAKKIIIENDRVKSSVYFLKRYRI